MRQVRLVSWLTLLSWIAMVGIQAANRPLTNATQERRFALVIGNNRYPSAPLQNAVADARAISGVLRQLGFDVTALEDTSRAQLVTALSALSQRLRSEDVVLFFFAGHGIQIGGENYLVPSDWDQGSPTAARLTTLAVSEIQEALSTARVSLIVLDACRNNPFSGNRALGRGLAPVEARGNLIAFATGAGQVATDNPGAGNGLFTQELLKALKAPAVTARELFYQVRQAVYKASNGRQFPAVYDGLLGDFTFQSGSGAVPPPEPPASAATTVLTPPAATSERPATSGTATEQALTEADVNTLVVRMARLGGRIAKLPVAAGESIQQELDAIRTGVGDLHQRVRFREPASKGQFDQLHSALTQLEVTAGK